MRTIIGSRLPDAVVEAVYHYDVQTGWRAILPAAPPPELEGRNKDWTHLYNDDIMSMRKMEYPCTPHGIGVSLHSIALVDPDLPKSSSSSSARMVHAPNGQLPAYEWAFVM